MGLRGFDCGFAGRVGAFDGYGFPGVEEGVVEVQADLVVGVKGPLTFKRCKRRSLKNTNWHRRKAGRWDC